MDVKFHENLSIDRIKRAPLYYMDRPHIHDQYELYYLLSGSRKYFVDHTIYTLEKNDLLIIAKGSLHASTYISNEAHERFVLYFDETALTPLIEVFGQSQLDKLFLTPKLTIPSNSESYIENLLQKILIENQYKDLFSFKLITNYFEELILFLLRYQTLSATHYTTSSESDEAIENSAKYICNNYNQSITLEFAAQIAHMSPTYFSKKFKQVTGFRFKEYLNQVRLREASNKLLNSKLSITEIALECGFNDSNYFGDLFKKNKGMSPIQYRKMLQH